MTQPGSYPDGCRLPDQSEAPPCPECRTGREPAEFRCDPCARRGRPAPMLCGDHHTYHTEDCESVTGWCYACDRHADDHEDGEVCPEPPPSREDREMERGEYLRQQRRDA